MFFRASGIWPGSGLCWRGESPGELQPLSANGCLLLAEIALK